MSLRVHVLDASGELTPYAAFLTSCTRNIGAAVRRRLPLQDVDIVYFVNPAETIPEIGGIGGFTPDAHTIFVSVNPHHPKFKVALKRELGQQLAHELHHCVRWRNPGYGKTLFEAMVSEGLADHFSMELTGTSAPPWSHAL